MKRFVAITAAVLLMAALFVGCGGSSPAGKYMVKTLDGQDINKAISAMLEESGMTMDDYLELFEIKSVDEFMSIELKSDGSAVFSVAGEEDETGTWKQEGDSIAVTINGETIDFALKGNELSAEIDDQKMVFAKK